MVAYCMAKPQGPFKTRALSHQNLPDEYTILHDGACGRASHPSNGGEAQLFAYLRADGMRNERASPHFSKALFPVLDLED
jgi:hypothetical protein